MNGLAPAQGPADDADTHTLAMPFVVCSSTGGRYDDEAFGAGVECGLIYAELGQCERIGATPRPRWVVPGIFKQVDLIAMRFGYTVTAAETDEHGGWVRAVFRRPGAVES